MWIRRNINPAGKSVGDCVVRAIGIATGQTWDEVYDEICEVGRQEKNMPSANSVWGKYLYDMGFEPFLLPSSCPPCVTVREFCRLFPRGTYIVGTGEHAVAVISGNYYDSWDSGNEELSFYWRID